MPAPIDLCGRCGADIPGVAHLEHCSVCGGALCRRCWVDYGECVHRPEDLVRKGGPQAH